MPLAKKPIELRQIIAAIEKLINALSSPQNLHHYLKYIYRQNFFARQQMNAQALDRPIKTTLD